MHARVPHDACCVQTVSALIISINVVTISIFLYHITVAVWHKTMHTIGLDAYMVRNMTKRTVARNVDDAVEAMHISPAIKRTIKPMLAATITATSAISQKYNASKEFIKVRAVQMRSPRNSNKQMPIFGRGSNNSGTGADMRLSNTGSVVLGIQDSARISDPNLRFSPSGGPGAGSSASGLHDIKDRTSFNSTSTVSVAAAATPPPAPVPIASPIASQTKTQSQDQAQGDAHAAATSDSLQLPPPPRSPALAAPQVAPTVAMVMSPVKKDRDQPPAPATTSAAATAPAPARATFSKIPSVKQAAPAAATPLAPATLVEAVSAAAAARAPGAAAAIAGTAAGAGTANSIAAGDVSGHLVLGPAARGERPPVVDRRGRRLSERYELQHEPPPSPCADD